MASFTYAAAVRPYKEREEEGLAAAAVRAEQDAAQRAQIADQQIAAQRAVANEQIRQAQQAYNQQFDINAAQQYANERRLREQMANYGIEQSGYNATNQTALALQRGRADAAARLARQNAVDTINQNLMQSEAEIRQNQAEAALARQQQLQDQYMDLAYNMYRNDIGLAQDERDFAYNQQQDERNYALTLKKYVDSHNADIFSLMQSAYNSGNAALGNEYAKQLWQLGDDGIIRQGAFDTSGAAAYARRIGEYQLTPRTTNAPTQNTVRKTGAFGIPTEYETLIRNAVKATQNAVSSAAKETAKQAALDLLYRIDTSEQARADGISDEVFAAIMSRLGITESDYNSYLDGKENK